MLDRQNPPFQMNVGGKAVAGDESLMLDIGYVYTGNM